MSSLSLLLMSKAENERIGNWSEAGENRVSGSGAESGSYRNRSERLAASSLLPLRSCMLCCEAQIPINCNNSLIYFANETTRENGICDK